MQITQEKIHYIKTIAHRQHSARQHIRTENCTASARNKCLLVARTPMGAARWRAWILQCVATFFSFFPCRPRAVRIQNK